MNESLKDRLIAELYSSRRDGMFGDGQERDMIMDGCTIVGLNEMDDKELIEEYEQYVDDDDEDELLVEIRQDKEVIKLLTESSDSTTHTRNID